MTATAQQLPQNDLPWTLQQTLTMLRRGHHPRDIAKMRNRSEGTIVNHVMTLANRGESFDLTEHLDEALLDELRPKAADWQPGDPLGPIINALDEACDTTTLKLHLIELMRESV